MATKFTCAEAKRIADAMMDGVSNPFMKGMATAHAAEFIEAMYSMGFYIGSDDRKKSIEALQNSMQDRKQK